MAAATSGPVVWRFENVQVDTATRRVTVAGERCELEPKSYRLLTFLIENRERALTKDEIFEQVWSGTAVTDNALTRAVAQIRKALGDDSRQPRYIETVPTVGYRFIAAVEAVPTDPPDPAVEPAPSPPETEASAAPGRRRSFAIWAAAALAGIATAAGVWWNRADSTFVRTSAIHVEKLLGEGRYDQAYSLAQQVLRRAPNHPTVQPLISEITDVLTIRSTPPGADVFLRRLDRSGEVRIGQTPLDSFSVVRGEYTIAIRKPGYADFERSVSSRLARAHPRIRMPWNLTIDTALRRAADVPPGMVAVDATEHKLAAYSRPVNATVRLAPYFLDKFEVSNREFKEFADAGGYNDPRFWAEAGIAARLKDRTGVSAPRQWIGGAVPDGKADHPVTGVTWHEAYAYCQFRGKTLPTVFQWEEAARAAMGSPFGVVFPWGLLDGSDVTRRANFEGPGTVAALEFPFGMSPYGAYHMAGNVSEWLLNRYDQGYMTAGGGWADPVYSFGSYQPRAALNSDASLGFRCCLTAKPANGDQGTMSFTQKSIDFDYPVSSAETFRSSLERYRYPQAPLHAEVVSVEEKEAWRREEIAFDGYGGKRAKAYLYLPRTSSGPYQTIQFLGGASWFHGMPVTVELEGRGARLAPYVRGGRAVFMVVLEGFAGREPVGAYVTLAPTSPEYRDILKEWTIDMRRGVDYLLTRPDIDGSRIAFWNTSTAEVGIVFAAVDGRYGSLILNGAPEVDPSLAHVQADANPLHFAPHIRAPKLILTGQYDDWASSRPVSLHPVFRLLRGPRKDLTYVGGHVPPAEVAVPLVNAFLDETLGKVTLGRR